MNVYTYKGVVSITWIVNDNGKYPSFYLLQFITVLYHILLKPEFLLQRTTKLDAAIQFNGKVGPVFNL